MLPHRSARREAGQHMNMVCQFPFPNDRNVVLVRQRCVLFCTYINTVRHLQNSRSKHEETVPFVYYSALTAVRGHAPFAVYEKAMAEFICRCTRL